MEKRELKVGDVLQMMAVEGRPEYEGCFLVVTEPKSFGAQGYFLSPFENVGLTRFEGIAYLRVRYEEVEYVGHAPLVLKRKEDEEV